MNSTKASRSSWIAYFIQEGCALIGLAASLYLWVQHTRLKSGIQAGASFCSFGKYANCDTVNASRYAEVLGVPLAALGVFFFFALLLAGLLNRPTQSGFRAAQRVFAWATAAALLLDCGLFLVQAIEIGTFCVLCLLTYLCNAGHLAANLAGVSAQGKFLTRLRFAFRKTEASFQWPLLRFAATLAGTAVFVGGLAFFMPGWIGVGPEKNPEQEKALAEFFQRWNSLPAHSIEVRDGDGKFGNPNAKVRIVEFSDFQCPHCRHTAGTMHTFLKGLEDKVYFVFKHFPLDASCNPALKYPMHLQACLLARLATCAAQKGTFWPLHDIVFLQMSEDDITRGLDGMRATLAPALTDEEITVCLRSEMSLRDVTQDIELGESLGIKGTPSVFINGKLVTIPLTPENLKHLVDLEAAAP